MPGGPVELGKRLTKTENDILNGDFGRPSPVGKKARDVLLGDRLDALACLGQDTPAELDPPGTVVGADLILITDLAGVLPGPVGEPKNVGEVLRLLSSGVGGVLPPPALTEGAVVVEIDTGGTRISRRLRQSEIDPDLAILSFTNGSPLLEIGSTLLNPAFTATYSVSTAGFTRVEVRDDQGGSVVDVLGMPAGFTYGATYTPTTPNDAVVWTLEVDELGTDIATHTTRWVNRNFYGAAAPATYDEAFIEGLANNALDQDRARTFTVDAGATEHIYFCEPSRFNPGGATPPVFTIGGFESIFVLQATVSVTNASGFTENYDVWESTNPDLGDTTVQVS